MQPAPMIPAPAVSAQVPASTGPWEIVRHFSHWRVYRKVTFQTVIQVGLDTLRQDHHRIEHHRGSDGFIRAFDSEEAAENRAAKLNTEKENS